PDEAPAAALEVSGQRLGLRRLGHLSKGRPAQGPSARRRFEAPQVCGERAVRLHQLDGSAGIVDNRLDLAPVTHDGGVRKQARDVWLPETGDPLEVEAGERATEGLALAQYRQPGEAGLEALEAELLEQPPVVCDREAPLAIVVGAILGRRTGPPAASHTVVAADDPVGGLGLGWGRSA